MRLREHPKLRWHGQPTWPPAFGGNYAGTERFPQGEQGILRDVKISPSYVATESVSLMIDFEGHPFSAELFFDDADFLKALYPKLCECVGQPISTVGDMEVNL